MKNYILIVMSFFLATLITNAQTTTSNIKGVVLDESTEPLLGANIVAIHTPTGTKYGAITNEDGRFNMLNLRIGGPYEITISYVGFKTETQQDVFLTLGKTFNIEVSLVSATQDLDEVVVTSDQAGTFRKRSYRG